jgi:hypothetical protein
MHHSPPGRFVNKRLDSGQKLQRFFLALCGGQVLQSGFQCLPLPAVEHATLLALSGLFLSRCGSLRQYSSVL